MPETLMTDAANTQTELTSESTATTTTDATATTEAAAAATTDATTTGDNAASEESKPEEQKATGAPEKYDFKAPDGQTFDDGVIANFGEAAKAANLPQDVAQAMLDKMGPAISKSIADKQEAQMSTIQNEWRESSTHDKEFGGDKLNENLAVAKKAVDKFGSPELKEMLTATGLGNNPEMIRFFYRAGKAMSEEKIVVGTEAKSNTPHDFNSMADRMYGSR